MRDEGCHLVPRLCLGTQCPEAPLPSAKPTIGQSVASLSAGRASAACVTRQSLVTRGKLGLPRRIRNVSRETAKPCVLPVSRETQWRVEIPYLAQACFHVKRRRAGCSFCDCVEPRPRISPHPSDLPGSRKAHNCGRPPGPVSRVSRETCRHRHVLRRGGASAPERPNRTPAKIEAALVFPRHSSGLITRPLSSLG